MDKLLIVIALLKVLFFAQSATANPFDYNVLGVIASTQGQKGVALMKNKTTGKVSAFKEGQEVTTDFKIEKIEKIDRKTVVMLFEGKRYNLNVGDDKPSEVQYGSGMASEFVGNLQNADGIEKNGNTLKVSKALKESLAGENLGKVLMQAAALPYVENGRLVGFEILEIEAGSIFEMAGLKNGDIVTQINDQPITDAALAIRALNALKKDSSASFGYIRGSTPMQLVVQIN